eukprot:15433741-Alexandrium_andersonii.AAC.1
MRRPTKSLHRVLLPACWQVMRCPSTAASPGDCVLRVPHVDAAFERSVGVEMWKLWDSRVVVAGNILAGVE